MRLCLDTIEKEAVTNKIINNEMRLCLELHLKFLLLNLLHIKDNKHIYAILTRKNFGTLMLLLVLTLVTLSAAQAHKPHMLSVQYSVLDHRLRSLSVQPPPHTLDQLAAVVLLPAAVGGKMA